MTYRTVLSEPEPISVQVVEWVGLVASGFQFLLGLAAVFAEEVGGFRLIPCNGKMDRAEFMCATRINH